MRFIFDQLQATLGVGVDQAAESKDCECRVQIERKQSFAFTFTLGLQTMDYVDRTHISGWLLAPIKEAHFAILQPIYSTCNDLKAVEHPFRMVMGPCCLIVIAAYTATHFLMKALQS